MVLLHFDAVDFPSRKSGRFNSDDHPNWHLRHCGYLQRGCIYGYKKLQIQNFELSTKIHSTFRRASQQEPSHYFLNSRIVQFLPTRNFCKQCNFQYIKNKIDMDTIIIPSAISNPTGTFPLFQRDAFKHELQASMNCNQHADDSPFINIDRFPVI